MAKMGHQIKVNRGFSIDFLLEMDKYMAIRILNKFSFNFHRHEFESVANKSSHCSRTESVGPYRKHEPKPKSRSGKKQSFNKPKFDTTKATTLKWNCTHHFRCSNEYIVSNWNWTLKMQFCINFSRVFLYPKSFSYATNKLRR